MGVIFKIVGVIFKITEFIFKITEVIFKIGGVIFKKNQIINGISKFSWTKIENFLEYKKLNSKSWLKKYMHGYHI